MRGARSRVRRRPRASASLTARSSQAPAIGTATALAPPNARARSDAMLVTRSGTRTSSRCQNCVMAAPRRTAARRRGRAPSRPARGRSSWPGRGPGRTPTWSSSSVSRASDATIASASPPGRSTRPHAPANSVSPLNRIPSSSAMRQTEPSVWPGVWRTRRRISPNAMTPPSASSTAGTDGGISNGA